MKALGLTLVGLLVICSAAWSMASCIDRQERAEVMPEPPPDAAPVERPCGAPGASPADYRVKRRELDDYRERSVPELIEAFRATCLEDTNHTGVAHVITGGPYTHVNCWTGKQDQSGFVYEDEEIWSRSVYVGP